MRSAMLRTASLALVLAGALTACSSSPESTSETPSSPSSDQFPVTISGKFGDVTVSSQPERVVALGWGDAETALALGVQPVGASDWLAFGGDGVGPWADGLYDTAPTLIDTTDPSVESIAALDPDLILDTRASGDSARHDALAALGVPVVSVPAGADNYVTTWQQQLDVVGKALGRNAKADELKTELDAKFASAASANPEFAGKTVAVGARFDGNYGAYVTGDSRVDLMTSLGFVNSPQLDALATGNFYVPISSEQVSLLDADLTVMFPIGGDASAITDDPIYATVPSVVAGRDVVLADTAVSNAFSSGTTLGVSYALDNAVPKFAAAVVP